MRYPFAVNTLRDALGRERKHLRKLSEEAEQMRQAGAPEGMRYTLAMNRSAAIIAELEKAIDELNRED